MMFDKIYVLAKGGQKVVKRWSKGGQKVVKRWSKGGGGVYSGLPQDLKIHLSQCDIICNEFQVPIEVLLKVSSQGINHKNVKQ
jgi:hypothetical protein